MLAFETEDRVNWAELRKSLQTAHFEMNGEIDCSLQLA
jgi:hypothetical protein